MRGFVVFLCLLLTPLTCVKAVTPQPIALTGLYTIAAGPDNLTSNLPPAVYPYNIAWATDRPGGAGYMVSDGTQWTANAGPTGATGSAGTNGTNGNTILSGTTPPAAGLGNNGDFYVDVVASRMYGPKLSGVWGTGVSLIGATGPTGPAGTNAFGSPNARTLSLATAYQATDTTRPALGTINLTSTASISLSGGTTNSADVIIGATSAVASGTGTVVCKYVNSNTGALTIGLNLSTIAASPCTFTLPTGWFFAVRQTAGTVTITSAFDQSVG